MSDEELRHLERRAMTGDPGALLQYAINLNRTGFLVPSYPAYPFYTPPEPFLPITVNGLHHDNEGWLTLVPHPGTLYIRPTDLHRLTVFSPHPERNFPELNWLSRDVTSSSPLVWPGRRPDQQWMLTFYSAGNGPQPPQIEQELERKVTSWVDGHSREMRLAQTLDQRYQMGQTLKSYFGAMQTVNDLRADVEKKMREWLKLDAAKEQALTV